MAKKVVLVCDSCGASVEDNHGSAMRLNWRDARRGAKRADLCDDCSTKMPGKSVTRRGRRPRD